MTGAAADGVFRDDVLDGLAREAKNIPCKYLYDERGVALFEQICELDEYYLTRAEIALLEHHGRALARLVGPGARIVEFGGATPRKARLLLAALDAPAAYVPVDVANGWLHEGAQALAAEHPGIAVAPVCADYTRPFALPDFVGDGRMLGFFPGSSIGNLRPRQARDFLGNAARMVGRHGLLLIGVDLKKDAGVLNAAYNDSRGISAAFNLNLLDRINRELGGTFDLRAFEHWARYDAREGRVEIAVVSRRPQTVAVCGREFRLGRREPIHTEDSYKYSVAEFHWLADQAGLVPAATWVDSAGYYSLHLLAPAEAAA